MGGGDGPAVVGPDPTELAVGRFVRWRGGEEVREEVEVEPEPGGRMGVPEGKAGQGSQLGA